jgi:hypothetical protein
MGGSFVVATHRKANATRKVPRPLRRADCAIDPLIHRSIV